MYYIISKLPLRKVLFVTPSLTLANKKLDNYTKQGFVCFIEKK